MAHKDLVHLEQVNKEILINRPFSHFCIDDFLTEDFANNTYHSFSEYQEALEFCS